MGNRSSSNQIQTVTLNQQLKGLVTVNEQGGNALFGFVDPSYIINPTGSPTLNCTTSGTGAICTTSDGKTSFPLSNCGNGSYSNNGTTVSGLFCTFGLQDVASKESLKSYLQAPETSEPSTQNSGSWVWIVIAVVIIVILIILIVEAYRQSRPEKQRVAIQ